MEATSLLNKDVLKILSLQVELYDDKMMRSLYATDASVYRQVPLAVAFPKNEEEIKSLVLFAKENKVSLIPRTAGTSLAGQCVGEGIVVDVSKYFTNIIELNVEERWVKVQPGVIRDELNRFLHEHDLFFSPNTSTSNRCMMGGMVGNNSSGSTSIRYGVTRDKVLALKTILSDGSVAVFDRHNLDHETNSSQSKIENKLFELLRNHDVQEEIKREFPDERIKRRNTGYALDMLIQEPIFQDSQAAWNVCKLLCGSEGTLAFTTEITLQLDPLPPRLSAMVVAHYDSVDACLSSVVPVMKHRLFACEMMDKIILDCTKDNPRQAQNRYFIEGDPKAILMLELKADDHEDLDAQIWKLRETIDKSELSYASVVLHQEEVEVALELRKAGLGVLANLAGDKKSVACIEDTAVPIEVLSEYIKEFTAIMDGFGQKAIYYAHAGAGELHLRPMLNLKLSKDRKQFRSISKAVAELVKKYNGSLSGEHGDGRVRAEFIPMVVGEKNYEIFKKVKSIFDPENIFNPGKIVDPKPMDTDLRYEEDRVEPEIDSFYNFQKENGILQMAEKCNGSGDCRKMPKAGGGMCPSYQATKDEKDTTRARANILREVLTHGLEVNAFHSQDMKAVYDLCVGCKACASECPSNVDAAILKSEFLHQYYKNEKRPFRDKVFAYNYKINKLLTHVKPFSNLLMSGAIGNGWLKSILGVAKQRSLPLLSNMNLKKELRFMKKNMKKSDRKIYLFLDEFSTLTDAYLVVQSIELLIHLGYEVLWTDHEESGRSFISKGFLPQAKKVANKNIALFHELIQSEIPLIGIEPSAILGFRDEYMRLSDDIDKAKSLAAKTFVIEEFLYHEMIKKNIKPEQFDAKLRNIKVHVHCHQKALSDPDYTIKLLSMPINHQVQLIQSGCCGMAGSFGYEKEHYEVSMKMAELQLFPAIREAKKEEIIVANGTSCRHQIKDGLDISAVHPVEVLHRAMTS